ncbi:MAG: glycosyltransferase [Fibrobacter sp.]|nr:glycosyltransferase [Fibrobacter sp.]
MSNVHFDVLYQYEPNLQILERFREAGLNCIQIPDKVHHPLKHLWAIFRIFRKGRYDVVHSHLDWFMNGYVCFLAMLAGVKKRIAHHHQAYSKWGFLCFTLRMPCKLFATHWLACGEAAAVNGWGKNAVKKNKVKILPNAIDSERFKFCESARREVRAKYGIADDDFVVGHVGRFYPQKNHTFLIDVFAELYKKKSSAKLLLLGDGPLQEQVKQKVNSLGLSNAVIFVGLQKDTAPFYSAMDVFAFPSLWEGLPLTLVEAQYCGLPCVVSHTVTKEVVVSKAFEFFDLKSAKVWTNCLQKTFRQNELTSDQFNIEKCIGELEEIYRS